MSKQSRTCLALAAGLLLLAYALRVAAARFGAALFPLLRRLTRAINVAQGLVTGVLPCALWDVGLVLLAVAALVWLVRCHRQGRSLGPTLCALVLLVSLNASCFVVWSCNHYAPPLADVLVLELREYSQDELVDATRHYLVDAARLATQVPRDGGGALARQDLFELARIAGASYAGLSDKNEVFEGSTAPIKALLVWGEPLLYSGHTGIFWAMTGEACVPLNCATADLPYIMCHEAAHRLGIASEQEANFAAYLACEASEDARLRYSGAYNAFCYCLGALWRQDPEAVQQLLQEVADEGLYEGVVLVLADRDATRAHYAAYEGGFGEVGRAVNDGYLKSFGESSGVRSYGLVVDYLIAWQQQGT